jgi:predicted nucleotidyltransferase
LSEAGILIRRREGHQVYFQANSVSPVFPEIKSLVIKTVGIADVLRNALAPLVDRIDRAFIYGSFAKNEEKGASDVDVMVIGDVSTREVVAAFRDAQKLLAREINPSVYAPHEFRDKLRSGHYFVKRVVSGPIIMLHGDEPGTKNLGRKRMD